MANTGMGNQVYEKVSDGKQTRPPADPQGEAGFLSLLTAWWMNGVFQVGARRPLEESDFLPLQEEDETKRLTEKIQKLWCCEQKDNEKSGGQPRFWRSVFGSVSSFGDVGVLCFAGLVDSFCRILQPLYVWFLISQLASFQDGADRRLLYICAACMFVTAVIKSLAMHQFNYRSMILGMRLRAALKAVVYLKVLVLAQDTLRDFTTGHVYDLVSNDVQRMELAPKMFLRLWLSLFDLVVTAYLTWHFVGWQALAGLAFLVLLVPFTAFLSHINGKFRRKTAEVTDRRVLLMNEVVSAIRTVKINAWESIYRDKIGEIRREEISVIRRKSAIISGLSCLLYTSPAIAVFLSVVTIALTGRGTAALTVERVFVLIALINLLRLSVSFYLAFGMQAVVEGYVSLDRIQQFLQLTNLPHLKVERYLSEDDLSPGKSGSSSADKNYNSALVDRESPSDSDHNNVACTNKSDATEEEHAHTERKPNACVSVSNLTVRLPRENSNKCILRAINFEAAQGSLVVLSGPVGSGKSSMLAAINKEIAISEGNILCSGTVAYVSQTPWIFPGTIRENIIFGKDYDEERFNLVVEVCALQRDMDIFPDSDHTIVGEKGASLSGGQQARISLARAVYADADVYLMDDPLSAVDANVGAHIFEKCICDFLSAKTRLFVTHQMSYMKMSDEVILLCKGEVLTKGRFADLMEDGVLSLVLASDEDVDGGPTETRGKSATEPSAEKGVLLKQNLLPEDGLFIPEEDRSIGTLSFKMYWNYFRAGTPSAAIVGIIVLFILTQGLLVFPDIWLSQLIKKPTEEQRSATNLLIYAGMIGTALAFALARAFLFYHVSLRSSENLHDRMVLAIIKAPVLFFDTNPVGRILNRFSKDVGSMDEILPNFFIASMQLILMAVAGVLIPTVVNYWILLAVVPLLAGFLYIVNYYLRSSRELKRLESICRSPVFSHMSETISGLDTIRSRGRQADFIKEFYGHQDKHNQAYNMCMASIQWMGVRVDFISGLFVGAVAAAAIVLSYDANLSALALVYVINIVGTAQFAVQQCSDVENQMTSVERVMTYTEIESEPGYNIDTKPPEDWPRDASVAFNKVSLRYYPGGPQVLRDLNINIKGKAKIGVAGRTGAGKSSIIAALLRMPEAANGVITVDGLNIATLNLQDSRRCVSVLSQKPVLFSGSLRRNLDPLTRHEDADLWRALDEVQLKPLVEHLEGHLDYGVFEGGGNFSVGERQLLCLARVLLQRNKVVILDEPTAHVDPTTERIIQNTVRDQLKECTVITVAHRLNTIRDCDKILVMQGGTAVEFDNYQELIKKVDGVFAGMAKPSKSSAAVPHLSLENSE